MSLSYRIKDAWYKVRQISQKIFRKNHISDSEVWEMYSHLVKFALPRIQAFKAAKRMGFHIIEDNYDYAGPYSKEKDDLAQAKWEEVIDKILFAFEFTYQENFFNRKAKKLEKKIKEKYGDWDAKTPENKSYFLWKTKDDDYKELVDSPDELTEEDKKNYLKEDGPNWAEKNILYHNTELHMELSKKAQEGFGLFGKYFQGLWD